MAFPSDAKQRKTVIRVMRRQSWTIAICLLVAWPGVALAQVTLKFDGATHQMDTQADTGRAGFTRFMVVDAVSFGAVAGPEQLVLELALPPRARQGDQPHDARILYLPDGWRDYWTSPPDFPEGGVVVTHLVLSGPAPRITGYFAVPLCFTKGPTQVPDLSRCQSATGRFDTPLTQD